MEPLLTRAMPSRIRPVDLLENSHSTSLFHRPDFGGPHRYGAYPTHVGRDAHRLRNKGIYLKAPPMTQPFPSLLSSLPATWGKRLLRPPVPRAACYLANRSWISSDSTVLRLYFLLSRPPADARARWKNR
ncbi:hypothetical protein BHE74_00010815 [Ensete ventricosum]|nr:hypothetical protein BHE74_00010815 [Ensete ventricosum]RZR96247.1 hypothetical protein BHM03_00025225 [Ensete ventricosum]